MVALPATAGHGPASRIVAQLSPGTAVSVARGDMDLVVTEYGIADLRQKTVDERAAALIAIAAPPFRDDLTRAWAERRAHM
jgi:4-hydroxybutyrate CoA-transferase